MRFFGLQAVICVFIVTTGDVQYIPWLSGVYPRLFIFFSAKEEKRRQNGHWRDSNPGRTFVSYVYNISTELLSQRE